MPAPPAFIGKVITAAAQSKRVCGRTFGFTSFNLKRQN
jgi:hypothetical protein